MHKNHHFPSYITTDKEHDFKQELLAQSAAYLQAENDHHYANTEMGVKYAVLIMLTAFFYGVMLQASMAWLFIGGYVLFMLFSVVLALNVLHDAAHAAVMKDLRLNWLLNRFIAIPLGLEPEYWRVRHNLFHHGYPNVEGHDLDIEENGILRQAPKQKWLPHMRFQHLYWPFTASLALFYMAWYFDWRDRLGKTPLVTCGILMGWRGWLVFLSNKIFHLILCLLVPYLFASAHGLSWGWVLLAYFVAQMIASLVIVFLFLGTHWVNPTFHEPDENNQINCGWYLHCFGTTCDWDPPKFLAYWLGGSDYHLTHHLFSNWHHRHYRPLAEIVRKVSERHDYPYRRISYRTLLRAQQRFLKEMGQNPHKLKSKRDEFF